MSEPRRRTVPFSDGNISLLEWGQAGAAPTLVFSHANGFNASTYKTLLAPLASDFHIIAWDMRGHGESTLSTVGQSLVGWRRFRDDLLALLDRLALRPAVLAGHSLGASTALLAAAARPDIAGALVLAEPVMATDRTALKAMWARWRGKSAEAVALAGMALKRRNQFKTREDAVKNFTGRGAFRSWPPQMVADYVETGLAPDADGFHLSCAPQWEAAAFSVYPFGLGALGARIAVPVTILAGTVHSATTEEVREAFMRRHGHTRFVPVEGASHFLPMEHPDLVRAEIRRAAGLTP